MAPKKKDPDRKPEPPPVTGEAKSSTTPKSDHEGSSAAENVQGPNDVGVDPRKNIPVNQRPGAAEDVRGPNGVGVDPRENTPVNQRPGAAEDLRGPNDAGVDPREIYKSAEANKNTTGPVKKNEKRDDSHAWDMHAVVPPRSTCMMT